MRHVASICSGALLISLSACSSQSARNLLDKLTAKPAQDTESAQPLQPAQPTPHAKTASRAKKPDPKPEPTQQELVEYLHGKFLALSPSDGINDNIEVAFDPSTTTLTVTRPNGRCENFLNALDTNSMIWDIFDPSDSYNSREELLRLTVASVSGKKARICYDKANQVDNDAASTRARFLVSTSKVEMYPGFQKNMTKAFKELIVLSGGAEEKEIF